MEIKPALGLKPLQVEFQAVILKKISFWNGEKKQSNGNK